MLLEDVSLAQVRRGQRDVFLSEKHGEHLEWKRFRFLKHEYNIKTPDLNSTGPRGITTAKRDKIVDRLCPVMARTGQILRTRFWDKIPVNENSRELCFIRDRGEGDV